MAVVYARLVASATPDGPICSSPTNRMSSIRFTVAQTPVAASTRFGSESKRTKNKHRAVEHQRNHKQHQNMCILLCGLPYSFIRPQYADNLLREQAARYHQYKPNSTRIPAAFSRKGNGLRTTCIQVPGFLFLQDNPISPFSAPIRLHQFSNRYRNMCSGSFTNALVN